jgi:hypothetical protein
MTPHEFGSHLGMQLREKQAIGFGDISKRLGQAYKAYKTVSTPATVHATRLLPKAVQPMARRVAQNVPIGLTGAMAYGAYDSAADATSASAQRVAQGSGVADPKVLQEVGTRARSQMLPMAYRSVAPSWLGGDTTATGQKLSNGIRTVAQHNILPVMFRPSATATNAPAGVRALQAAVINPLSAATSAFVAPRPSAQQMWQNVPEDRRRQIGQDMLNAATQSSRSQDSNSPLAQSMQHVFEPVVKYHQQNTQ